MNLTVTYPYDSNVPATNGVYVIFVSDSLVVSHPVVNYCITASFIP